MYHKIVAVAIELQLSNALLAQYLTKWRKLQFYDGNKLLFLGQQRFIDVLNITPIWEIK